MGPDQDQQAMAALALLADELRQRLYRFVAAQPGPVTRDQAAAAVGISRKLAAFHLDKLTAAGLLETTAPDPASRRPGPGRAPKAYQPAATELAISIPQRRYDALGDVLAQAIVAEGPASTTRHTAQQLARERGQALGERVRTERRLGRLGPERALTVVSELLAACGYAPARAPTQLQLLLRNCPFQQLARRAPSWSAGSTSSSWLACWRGCTPAGSRPSSNPTRHAAACSCRADPRTQPAPLTAERGRHRQSRLRQRGNAPSSGQQD
jgi:predicted ArsR family transcriptional regulator